jgi:hypothetical protein
MRQILTNFHVCDTFPKSNNFAGRFVACSTLKGDVLKLESKLKKGADE